MKISKITNQDVLILDALDNKPSIMKNKMVLPDVTEARNPKNTTIFYVKLRVKNWNDAIKEITLLDVILDSIIHKAIRFEFKGESIQ
jgi:hypothetical protein